jgi:hypothetical protein
MALRFRDLEWPDHPKKQEKSQDEEQAEEQADES